MKAPLEFKGQRYFDDRMFVLYLCRATLKKEPDGVVFTTIHHENVPDDAMWCVATYRNCNRYPLFTVDQFSTKETATAFVEKIEPETPLISLGGNSPPHSVLYEQYLMWKMENNFKEYDYKSLYSPTGTNATEVIAQTKEQFRGLK